MISARSDERAPTEAPSSKNDSYLTVGPPPPNDWALPIVHRKRSPHPKSWAHSLAIVGSACTAFGEPSSLGRDCLGLNLTAGAQFL